MPVILDPAIVALVPDPVKRTNFIVAIDTPQPRFWTPYPYGLTVSGRAYQCLDVHVTGLVESLDGPAYAMTLSVANIDGQVTDLARDAINLRKPITVSRVWFDADWQLAGTELWFQGLTGKPSLKGGLLTLAAGVYDGRKGQSPSVQWPEVMTAHAVPDSSTRIQFRR
jgi:hypothetical protein